MHALPPLECLRFFDAAARHESFVRAAVIVIAETRPARWQSIDHILCVRSIEDALQRNAGEFCVVDVDEDSSQPSYYELHETTEAFMARLREAAQSWLPYQLVAVDTAGATGMASGSRFCWGPVTRTAPWSLRPNPGSSTAATCSCAKNWLFVDLSTRI